MRRLAILALSVAPVGCATAPEGDAEEPAGEVLCREEMAKVSLGKPRPALYCGPVKDWRNAVGRMDCVWLEFNIRWHYKSPGSALSLYLKNEYAGRCG